MPIPKSQKNQPAILTEDGLRIRCPGMSMAVVDGGVYGSIGAGSDADLVGRHGSKRTLLQP